MWRKIRKGLFAERKTNFTIVLVIAVFVMGCGVEYWINVRDNSLSLSPAQPINDDGDFICRHKASIGQESDELKSVIKADRGFYRYKDEWNEPTVLQVTNSQLVKFQPGLTFFPGVWKLELENSKVIILNYQHESSLETDQRVASFVLNKHNGQAVLMSNLIYQPFSKDNLDMDVTEFFFECE